MLEDKCKPRAQERGIFQSGNKTQMRLILASQSPRRKELLAALQIDFETVPSVIEECIDAGKAPEEAAIELALQKANAVKDQILACLSNQERVLQAKKLVVLGADTMVILGPTIFGKPSSKENAFEMLSLLSGKRHEVRTGVAIVAFDHLSGAMTARIACGHSSVFMRPLTSAEIEAYISTDEPMDKAGAYALQGAAAAFIEKIDGCVSNIIGLPMNITVGLLRQAGIEILGC